ncbi:MAG: hypothetical protein V7K42_12445 [Nostoc sp.]
MNAPPTKPAAHVNSNIKPHLDTFEVGLFLCLESICNHVSSAIAVLKAAHQFKSVSFCSIAHLPPEPNGTKLS